MLTVEIAVLFPGPTGYGGWLLQRGVPSNWRGTVVCILSESPGARRRKECRKIHRVQAVWISGAEEIFVAVLVDRDCDPVLRYNTLRRDLEGVAGWFRLRFRRTETFLPHHQKHTTFGIKPY